MPYTCAHGPDPAAANAIETMANTSIRAGSTISRLRKLNCRCMRPSGTLVSAWMIITPEFAAAMAVTVATKSGLAKPDTMPTSGAVPSATRASSTPVPPVAQKTVLAALGTSFSRWMSAPRRPPSETLMRKPDSSAPAT